MMNLKKLLPRNVRGKIMYALKWLPDEAYIKLFYWAVTHRHLNLKTPTGYNEKLNWLKIHDNNHPEYTSLADKIAVREHINKVLGEGYAFPLIAVWDKVDEMDFDSLPNSFVLKCNHDSGSARLIKDKSALTQQEIIKLRKYYNHRLKENFFYAGREYPYRNIKPKVFAEQLMASKTDGESGINDFKFFCFDGEPKLMLMVTGRQTEKHEDYFLMDGTHVPVQNGWTEAPVRPDLPTCFLQMQDMARRLSKGIKQVRMDFYEIDGKPYFGEYTFFSGGGFEPFMPEEWESKLGDWIKL